MKKAILLFTCIILCACNKKLDDKPHEIELPRTSDVLLYSNNEFEYGEIINIKDIILNEDIEITDTYLKTDVLGNNTLNIVYTKEDVKYQEAFNYEVKDKTPPLVYLNNSYSVTEGYKKDLTKAIPCIDNYDKNPTCSIEGSYDVHTAGRYNLKYIAEDSSGNKKEVSFVLIVNKPSKVVYSTSTTKIENVIKKYKNDNTLIGIDVSKWQGDINWEKVKNAGVEFAMIRIATQKDFHTDEIVIDQYFEKNIEGALANNIKVGLYIYTYATTEKEVIDQANYIIDKVKNYNIEMPIAYDWESFSSITGRNMSLTDFRNYAYKFIEVLEQHGYKGIIYGSKNYLNNFWYPLKADTWLAHYTNNLNKSNYEHEYVMWQLCNDGKVDGISDTVDIDLYYIK